MMSHLCSICKKVDLVFLNKDHCLQCWWRNVVVIPIRAWFFSRYIAIETYVAVVHCNGAEEILFLFVVINVFRSNRTLIFCFNAFGFEMTWLNINRDRNCSMFPEILLKDTDTKMSTTEEQLKLIYLLSKKI